MPKATPERARMTQIITVTMRPLGFLESLGMVGVDDAAKSVLVVAGATGSTVVLFVVSDLFSFVVDAPSGAMGFSVPA